MPIRGSPNGARHPRPQAGRDRPESVVAINRNAWSQSIGIAGRDHPVRADIMRRIAICQELLPTPRLWIPRWRACRRHAKAVTARVKRVADLQSRQGLGLVNGRGASFGNPPAPLD
jgi:hypothetical protein